MPNFFSFATSELSQDAFICWLASWSDVKYASVDPDLHVVGRSFVERLIEVCGRRRSPAGWGTTTPPSFACVQVERQVEHIDVVVTIDEDFVILIEDKTGTSDRGDQLERYKNVLVTARPHLQPQNVFPVYLKLEEQSDLEGVQKAGYGHFTRSDMLDVLAHYAGDNAILLDFREHIRALHTAVSSWRTVPLDNWTYHAWAGFFSELQQRIAPEDDARQRQSCGWDYVPNARGGFMGFWWGFQTHQEPSQHQAYFQLEEGSLCVKICVDQDDHRGELRWRWHQHAVEAAARAGIELVKPTRFGRGLYMTVAKLAGDYREVGLDGSNELDPKAVVALLDKVEKAVLGLV